MEDWLEGLDISVGNWEEDFSNGYLLGSILYRYGRLDTFGKFVNKPDWQDRNLALLSNGLDEIGVAFAPERLSGKESGYSRSLLKSVFFKLSKLLLSKDKRKTESGHGKTKSEKIEGKLEKFKKKRVEQAEKAFATHQIREKEIQAQQQEDRKAHLDAIRSNHLFMQEWNNEGRKHWQTNIQKIRAIKQHEVTVKTDVAMKYKTQQVKYIGDNAEDEAKGIEEFEKNLIRLGIDHNPDQASTGPKKKVNLAAEAAVTMARIREKKVQHMQALKEKETRINKMTFNQERTAKQNAVKQTLSSLFDAVSGLIRKKTQFCLKRLKKHCKTAKEVAAALPLKESAEKRRTEIVSAFESQQQARFRVMERELQQTAGEFKYSRREGKIEEMKRRHERSSETCIPLVNSLIEIVEAAANLLQERDQIPEGHWNMLMRYFVEGPDGVAEEISDEVYIEADTGAADDMIRFRPPSP